jgi:hypothetical protein
MNCSRTDLVFSDYSWHPAAALTHMVGQESAFDRHDGHQMLALLNSWAGSWLHEKSSEFFRNLERVIRQLVPARMATVNDVHAWVETHTPRL